MSCSCWCLLGINVSVSTSVCLSDVHISAVYQVFWGPCSPEVWLLLFKRYSYLQTQEIYIAMFFLCNVLLIMSAFTATTTTSPVTVVYSRSSLISMTVTVAPTSVGLVASGQHDVVLPPQLYLRDTVRVLLPSYCTAAAIALVPGAFSGTCQLCLGSLSGKFSLWQSWASHQFIMLHVAACYGVYFLLSGSHVAAMLFTRWCSTVGVCNTATIWSIPFAGICASWWWSVAHTRSALSGCFFHCFEWCSSCYSFSCPPAIPSIWWGIQPWELGRELPNPYTFPTWWGGVFFSRMCSPWYMVNSESVIGVKPNESGVVIGCQVDEYTCTWLLLSPHLCWFHGKVSTLTHLPLEPGCEDYPFMNKVVKTLSMVLTVLMDSCQHTRTGGVLWWSFDEADTIPSLIYRVSLLGEYPFW